MAKHEVCPNCGCDGVRPSDPLHKVTWDRLDGQCRRCGTHPAEHEVEQLTKRVELLERALAVVAGHAVVYDADDRPLCTACAAGDTKHDNCPVMGVVERLECPFRDDALDPLSLVVEALSRPVYVSRLTEDVPSHLRPDHVHRAGTEFAPIRCEEGRNWEIGIRVPDGDGGFWYESMVVNLDKTEVALVLWDPAQP